MPAPFELPSELQSCASYRGKVAALFQNRGAEVRSQCYNYDCLRDSTAVTRALIVLAIAIAFNVACMLVIGMAIALGRLPRQAVFLWAPLGATSWVCAILVAAESPLGQTVSLSVLAGVSSIVATLVFSKLPYNPCLPASMSSVKHNSLAEHVWLGDAEGHRVKEL